jgi:hemolysin activation/secretion protein
LRWSDATVVEEPFDEADFETTALTAGIGVVQPVWRTPSTSVRLGLIGEWRRSESQVDGMGFGFPGTGADPETGVTEISVLRTGGEWLHRTRSRVVVLRQLASVGLPVLGATENPSGIPDSQFASFLTQFRWAERFARLRDTELIFRTDLQLSTQPLVPLEQIAVGGMFSVRGYRENQIVRDQAAIGSLELRLLVWRSAERDHQVQLAPFCDVGRGWSSSNRDAKPPAQTLVGPGVGIRYRFRRFLTAELYWAASPSSVPDPPETSLQDEGIHFRVQTSFP